MERWAKKVAVVTGASSGIGAAIVKDLIKCDLIVVGLARRLDRLEEIKSSFPAELKLNFNAIKCDVRKETEVKNAFQWIENNLGGVDILINNAGIAAFEKLIDAKSENIRNILDVNVMGVVTCTQEAFQSMKKRGVDGHVILINSILGHYIPPGVNLSIYPASKYAVTAISEILRNEFQNLNTKIKISSISPGAVDTEITRTIPDERRKNINFLKDTDVSDAVLYVLSTPANVQISELTIRPF